MSKKVTLLVCGVTALFCVAAIVTVLLITKQEGSNVDPIPSTPIVEGTTDSIEEEDAAIEENATIADESSASGDTWVDLDAVTVIAEDGSVTQNPAESGSELELVTNKFIEIGCTGKVLEEHLDEMGEAEIPVLALRLGLDSWYSSAGPNGLYCAAVIEGEVIVEPYYGE